MRLEADLHDPTSLSPRGQASLAAGLSRRHFLRGLGAAVALPAFSSLGSSRVLAGAAAASNGLATTSTGAPLRSAFIFFPNGAIPSAWWPKEEGSKFALSRTLQPFEPIRQHIQVLGGLGHKTAEGGPDGAGDHARGNGTFLTGVKELKRILVTEHRRDFYRCLSEKMLTYALGRGLEYHDTMTVDQLVDGLDTENGRAMVLIKGIVLSTPFQRSRRRVGNPALDRANRTTGSEQNPPKKGPVHETGS